MLGFAKFFGGFFKFFQVARIAGMILAVFRLLAANFYLPLACILARFLFCVANRSSKGFNKPNAAIVA